MVSPPLLSVAPLKLVGFCPFRRKMKKSNISVIVVLVLEVMRSCLERNVVIVSGAAGPRVMDKLS